MTAPRLLTPQDLDAFSSLTMRQTTLDRSPKTMELKSNSVRSQNSAGKPGMLFYLITVLLSMGSNMEGRPKKEDSRIELVIIAVVIVVAVILAAWVLTPSISPLAGIHDTDGDGRADLRDAAPDDRTKWTWGVATIVVTIHSQHLVNETHYKVYLNEYLKKEGDLAPGGHVVKFISARFLIGSIDSAQIVVTVTSTGGELGDHTDQDTLTVYDGQAYALSFTV